MKHSALKMLGYVKTLPANTTVLPGISIGN